MPEEGCHGACAGAAQVHAGNVEARADGRAGAAGAGWRALEEDAHGALAESYQRGGHAHAQPGQRVGAQPEGAQPILFYSASHPGARRRYTFRDTLYIALCLTGLRPACRCSTRSAVLAAPRPSTAALACCCGTWAQLTCAWRALTSWLPRSGAPPHPAALLMSCPLPGLVAAPQTSGSQGRAARRISEWGRA